MTLINITEKGYNNQKYMEIFNVRLEKIELPSS